MSTLWRRGPLPGQARGPGKGQEGFQGQKVDPPVGLSKVRQFRRLAQQVLDDPHIRRGFRRGTGLVLAVWVLEQCLLCALYPFIRR